MTDTQRPTVAAGYICAECLRPVGNAVSAHNCIEDFKAEIASLTTRLDGMAESLRQANDLAAYQRTRLEQAEGANDALMSEVSQLSMLVSTLRTEGCNCGFGGYHDPTNPDCALRATDEPTKGEPE